MQISRHALHATALYLPYPKGKRSLFRATVPNDFKEWIKVNLPSCDIKKLELKIDARIEDFFQVIEDA